MEIIYFSSILSLIQRISSRYTESKPLYATTSRVSQRGTISTNHFGGDDSNRPISGRSRPSKSNSLVDLTADLRITSPASRASRGSSVHNDRTYSPSGEFQSSFFFYTFMSLSPIIMYEIVFTWPHHYSKLYHLTLYFYAFYEFTIIFLSSLDSDMRRVFFSAFVHFFFYYYILLKILGAGLSERNSRACIFLSL